MSVLDYQLQRRANNQPCLALGVMSGTSLDGIDLCLCSMKGVGSYSINKHLPHSEGVEFGLKVFSFKTIPFPNPDSDSPFANLRQDLRRIMAAEDGQDITKLMCRTNFDWSRFVGIEILKMLQDRIRTEGNEEELVRSGCFANLEAAKRSVVIGSHGQTVWHENNRHSTLQIGDTEVLAHVTGMLVVGNFRAADVAVGGCGAPLVPYFDKLMYSTIYKSGDDNGGIAFQNLGGIGNVTSIGRHLSKGEGDKDPKDYVCAFDTGPANVALNEFIERACCGCTEIASQSKGLPSKAAEVLQNVIFKVLGTSPTSYYDKDAAFSCQGTVVDRLLDEWMSVRFAVYFNVKPPKTAGREQFGAIFAEHLWQTQLLPAIMIGTSGADNTPLATFYDVCRTLVELSAASIADAYAHFLPQIPTTIVVSGGGKNHPLMMQRIQSRTEEHLKSKGKDNVTITLLSLNAVISTENKQIDVDDAKESIAFAALAHEKLNSLAINDPVVPIHSNVTAATGASREVALGQLSIPV